jgi:long-chain fatty acid transport protein
MLRKVAKGVALCAAVGFLGMSGAYGAGFQLYTEGSAEALGMGAAISARRDMVSNAWYNPASLTDFKAPQLMIGNTIVNLNISYDEDGYDEDLENRWRNVPHFYYVHPLSDGLVASLSLNVPYGLATEWQSGWNGSTLAIDTTVEAIYLTPALSYRVSDKLSLAAGFNLVRASAEIRKSLGPTEIELTADDLSWGYMFAANYKFNDAWNMALKFQSRVDLTLMGEAHYTNNMSGVLPGGDVFANGDAEGDLRLPATITLGISNRSFDKWVLGLDVIWTEWSTYDKLGFSFDDKPGDMQVGVAGESVAPKDWGDVYCARLGAEYQLNERWKLRGGYVFDQSPAKKETVGPEMPDGDRNMILVGCGYDQEKWGLDLAYGFLFAKKADAGALGDPVKVLDESGEYNTYVHFLSASFRYKF